MNDFSIFLFNNKRGGVDQIVLELMRNTNAVLYCNKEHDGLKDYITELGIERVVTYATIASSLLIFPITVKRAQQIESVMSILSFGFFDLLFAYISIRLKVRNTGKTLLVVMGGFPSAIYPRIAIMSAHKKCRVILNIHNDFSHTQFFYKLRDGLVEVALRYKITHLVTVSKNCLNTMLEQKVFSLCQKSYIYNGIKPNDYHILNPKKRGAGFNFGIVANFESRKGHEVAFRAFNLLRKSNKNFKLHLYGYGTRKETRRVEELLKQYDIEEITSFHGYIKDKKKIYSSLDIVVIPSIAFESFGLVLIEATAYGVPVISSECGGLGEVANELGCNNVFKIGDSAMLLEKIKRVLIDYDLYKKQSIEQSKLVKSKFNIDRMIMDYKKVIEVESH